MSTSERPDAVARAPFSIFFLTLPFTTTWPLAASVNLSALGRGRELGSESRDGRWTANTDGQRELLLRADLLRYPSHPPLFDKARILRAASPLHRRRLHWVRLHCSARLEPTWRLLALVPGLRSQPLEISLAPILDDSDCRHLFRKIKK